MEHNHMVMYKAVIVKRPFPRHRTRGGILRARFRRRGEAPTTPSIPSTQSSSWFSVPDIANLDVPDAA
jgi:hypothetical protein